MGIFDRKLQVITKEVTVKEKGSMFGGFINWGKAELTSATWISDKLIKANAGWVFRNNDVIAKAVSELEPQLYRMKVTNGDVEFEEIKDHPILDLLDRFNESLNRSEGFYQTQSHVKLTGDAFWLLVSGRDGLPEQIFLLQPDKVRIDISDFTDISARLIDGYTYKDRIHDEKGKTKEIVRKYKYDEVIHFKVPNPGNMFRGKSTVEALANEIDADNFATEVQKNFFGNGAIVDFVLTTEGKITDEQRQVLHRDLKGRYSGIRNAFNTLILGGGLKPEKLQFSNKELELIKLQEWFRDKIMVGFGNTKASLGLIDDVNRASHESSIISWKQNSVQPEMSRIVDTLNEYLVPKYGEDLILGYKDPIPENREAKVKEATDLKTGDIISQNEAREMLGFDTVDGGDEFGRERADRRAEEFAANMPKSLKYVDVVTHMRRTKFIAKYEKGREIYKQAYEAAKKLVKSRKEEPQPVTKRHEQFTNEQVEAYWQKQIHVTEHIETRFRQKLENVLIELREEAVDNMREGLGRKAAGDELIDLEAAKVKAHAALDPLIIEAMVVAGNQAFDLIDIKDPFVMSESLSKYVGRQVDKFTKSMVETDTDKLKDIIIEGVREGKSVPQIERQMRETFDMYAKSQTERITRTEVLRATNHASVVAFEESGVVVAKQWLTAGADDECEQYEGQVVELSGNFYDTGNEFQDGDPPLHPNCRCVVLPIVEGAKSFDSSSMKRQQELEDKIKELEGQVDKRTKEFRELKKQNLEAQSYISELEKIINE